MTLSEASLKCQGQRRGSGGTARGKIVLLRIQKLTMGETSKIRWGGEGDVQLIPAHV